MGRKRTIRLYSLVILFVLLVSPLSPLLTYNPDFDNVRGEQILDPTGKILGSDLEGKLGWNVSWIGDVNGDGFDDIVAGAPYADGIVGDWWNQSWLYRMKLRFDNSGQSESLQNFPVLVNLSSLNFDYSKAKVDGTDLRFLDADERTELNYHIEDWDTSGSSYIWVNVSEIEGGSNFDHIWMYYGNSAASNVQNIEGTYDDNFAGVWHFNETAGTHYDATKNNNDGEPYDGLNQNVQGKVDGADLFDGNDDLVNCSMSPSLNIASAITIEAWVKPLNIDNPSNDQNIVGKYELSGQSYMISLDDDPGDADDWDFKLSSNGTFAQGDIHVSNAVDRNQWQYMVGTWNGTTMLFYKDANIIGTDLFTGPIYQSTIELWIGDGLYYSAFEGMIDEVRISNTARSADWIAAQYLNMDNRFITYGNEEARTWWNFDWGYRRKLIFDNSAQTEDLTDFPVVVVLTTSNFDYLKTKGDGTDLRFISRDGITELSYHIEMWNPLGISYIWVNVTSIDKSSSSDYIWMYYDNPAAPNILDPSGTYNSDYIGVWHLNETSGLLYDATSNDNDGTPNGGTIQGIIGRIDGATGYDGLDDYVDINSLSLDDYTMDLWFKGDGSIIGFENVTLRNSLDLRMESADTTIYGARGEDRSGSSVSSGDINGDGINDTIIGSYGKVYIIYSEPSRPDPYSLDLDSQSANITIIGEAGNQFGTKVAAGDLNNDGFDDVIIGANQFDYSGRTNCGAAYVIYGYNYPSGTMIDLIDGTANITVYGGTSSDYLGRALATGDINNDGFTDLIVSADQADPGGRNSAGSTYVFYGENFGPQITIDLNSQSANLTIHGNNSGDASGSSMSAGDINNDGYDDVIIGAFGADPGGRLSAGETYVIYGMDYVTGTVIDLNSVSANITIYGNDTGDYLGYDVTSGDLNKDGFSEVIIGAYWADPPGGGDAGATYVINGADYTSGMIIDLNSTLANLTVFGDDQNDYVGHSVSSGDINNDGFDDLIMGASGFTPGGGISAGATYIVYGGIYSTGMIIDLNLTVANLTIHGDDLGDQSGYDVSSDDINDDGYVDVIIGAWGADPIGGSLAGETYVIYGNDHPSGTLIDLDTVVANLTIAGDNGKDMFSRSISSGDINGDGYPDVIIGASMADVPGEMQAGKVYVFYGSSDFIPVIDLAFDNADITIYGEMAMDYFGYSISSADVNNDGFDDVIVGASSADPPGRVGAGEAYVIYGGNHASGTIIDLNTSPPDITIYGEDFGDYLGRAIGSGDFNNDGFGDIVAGATWGDLPTGTNEGAAYVIFGGNYASGTIIDLNSGAANLSVYGESDTDYCGLALASGDVNGDGYDDLIIGAYGADPGGRSMAGETYVVFGSEYAPGSVIDLSSQSADMTIYGNGTNSFSGRVVASGDINNDGFSDVIIGAYEQDSPGRTRGGEVYVIYGDNYAPGFTMDLSSESANITIQGSEANDRLGVSVYSEDMNNDGISDLIIGAYMADSLIGVSQNGETYVIYGSEDTKGYVIDLSAQDANFTVFGNESYDRTGEVVHAADLNNDGFAEIIIGTYESNYKDRYENGEVYIVNPISEAEIIKVETEGPRLRTVFANSRNTSSTSSGSIDTGLWHHVTVTKNDALRLYVDGVLVGTANVEPGAIAGPLDFVLGALNQNDTLNHYFNGIIDELKISSDAKSPSWINAQHLSMTNNFITFGGETASPPESGNLSDSGAAYIFFGHPGISLANINISAADVTIHGGNSNDLFGWSIAGGVDVNNDGYDDVVMGSPGWDSNKGRAYIFHGRKYWNDWYSANDANLVITGESSGEMFGASVSNLGKKDENTLPFKGWEYRKSITINAIQVEDDLTDFPVMIDIFDIDLRDKARVDGYDIFFADPISEERLDHEVEYYDSSTGKLVAWVRIPYLSSSTNTTIDMYYGNFGQSIPMENPQAVWDANYSAVWHLNNDFEDSTRNVHHGVNTGSEDIGAIIANGQDFENDDSSDRIDVGNWNVPGQGLTLQAWVNFETFASDGRVISKADGGNNNDHTWMLSEVNDTIRMRLTTSSTIALEATSISLSTTPWYFFIGTYDGNTMRLRIDKTEVNSTSQTGDIQQDARKIAIGNQPEGGWKGLDGILDEVRVSSIRRSDTWLNTEYNNQMNPQTFYSLGEERDNNAIWQYRKAIKVLASQVPGDLTDFPVLVSLIDPDLKNRSRADGHDILFLGPDRNTLMDFEIEKYDSGSGELVAWVRIPYLSSITDSTFYMYYGNLGQAISLENPQGLWKNGYVGVYHMAEEIGNIENSASSNNDGVRQKSPTRTTGHIGYGHKYR
jgi:hypothetical protein